jgi:hypothetical protein
MTFALLAMLLLVAPKEPFIADATAEMEFMVAGSGQSVLDSLLDIDVLRRNMPGVVAIEDLPENQWLYKTERAIPFSDPFRADFVLIRIVDPTVTYQTPDPGASNWMSCRFETREHERNQTEIRVRMRVRLVREDGTAIHILAPILGETFISERMQSDVEEMLETFASNLQKEFENAEKSTEAVTERR